jgi:hypothetical protein
MCWRYQTPVVTSSFGLLQNLREMVFLLNGTPRSVDASLAVSGGR